VQKGDFFTFNVDFILLIVLFIMRRHHKN